MVWSTPAVAALLVLVMTSARVVTAACELACFYAPAVPHSSRSEPATTNPGHACHAPAPASVQDAGRLVPRATHARCGYEHAAVPFVVAAKSVPKADTCAVHVPGSALVNAVDFRPAERRLGEHTPPGAFAARVIPLRI